jgi:hypothetical protein
MSLPEIGSKRKRHIPGPTQYGNSISRLLTNHSDLKSAMYKWMGKVESFKQVTFQRIPGAAEVQGGKSVLLKQFSGMESDLMNIPFGLLVVKQTANGTFVGSDFGERCYITNFGQADTSGNPIVIQNANIYINRVVPFMTKGGAVIGSLKPGSKDSFPDSAEKTFTFFE